MAIKLLEMTDTWTDQVIIRRPDGNLMEFDMGHIMRGIMFDTKIDELAPNSHACGTSCCFLGFAPVVIPRTRKMSTWTEVHQYIMGACSHDTLRDITPTGGFTSHLVWSDTSDYLFGGFWPNSPEQAAMRLLKVFRGEEIPVDASYANNEPLPNQPAKDELIRQLKEYLC